MSEVAGRLAPQMGAWTLQKANGGRGSLGGVPGVALKSFSSWWRCGGTTQQELLEWVDVTVLDKSLSRLAILMTSSVTFLKWRSQKQLLNSPHKQI